MVFVTGATGYMGRSLIELLLKRGHRVRGLVRPGSENRLPAGCEAIAGDALVASSYQNAVAPADTLVHLVGTPKPAPWKERQFRAVDKPSALAAIQATRVAKIRHFIYVSVAQPAPIMQAYIQVRSECEQALKESGIPATILRPWYVLGPGHRWPLPLIPVFNVLERLPATRETALRLGFVWHHEMVNTLAWAVDHPASRLQVLEVPEIRSLGRQI